LTFARPPRHYPLVRHGSHPDGPRRDGPPFEGDLTLSIILSKAFVLAADARITDRSILSQIRR
jgi:hypothetical protein